MNDLAHLFLSPRNPKVLAGNLLGDYAKGRISTLAYPPDVLQGIRLHRAIDSYTDRHPVVLGVRSLFPPPQRRYAGIVLDVLYDHLLAISWAQYSPEPFPEFTAWVYGQLLEQIEYFPPSLQRVLPRMIEADWLGSYQRLEGVHFALDGISRRLTRPVSLSSAMRDIQLHYPALQESFHRFMPRLQDHCREILRGATSGTY